MKKNEPYYWALLASQWPCFHVMDNGSGIGVIFPPPLMEKIQRNRKPNKIKYHTIFWW